MRADYRSLVHTPAELSAEYVEWAKRIAESPGVRFGLPSIDERMIPLHPGDLVGFLGRPGHGKSSMLAYLARHHADGLLKSGKADTEVVVYVTWENTAEEIASFLLADDSYSVSDVAWGKVPMDDVIRQSISLVRKPIWIIGHGIGRAGKGGVIKMTPDAVLHAIESMQEDFGVKPSLMLFDYLQLIPCESAGERVAQVTEAAIRIKALGQIVGAPAVAAIQAARRVDDYDVKLPEQRDAQWASGIEQTCDKMFSFWRPAVTEGVETIDGKPIMLELEDRMYQVTNNLMFIRMIKQRFAPGRYTWPFYFNPAYLKLADLEIGKAPPGMDFDKELG